MAVWLSVECIKKEVLSHYPNARIESETKKANTPWGTYTSVRIAIAPGICIPLSYYDDNKRVALHQCRVYLKQGKELPVDKIIEVCS